jgi:hypothetical protein
MFVVDFHIFYQTKTSSWFIMPLCISFGCLGIVGKSPQTLADRHESRSATLLTIPVWGTDDGANPRWPEASRILQSQQLYASTLALRTRDDIFSLGKMSLPFIVWNWTQLRRSSEFAGLGFSPVHLSGITVGKKKTGGLHVNPGVTDCPSIRKETMHTFYSCTYADGEDHHGRGDS